ncbi:MAG: Hint domain-containing protein [Litoreibacter sp.]
MEELFLNGNQIASYTSLTGAGNNADRTVTVEGLQAVGSASDTYRIVVEQTNGASEFGNGQRVTIFNPDGSTLISNVNINPDEQQGAAAGDEYLIITQQVSFVIDLNGFPSGTSTRVYTNDDAGQNGDTTAGDNDGQLDFIDVVPAVCFTPDTFIDTNSGPRLISTLCPGDTVRDIDGLDLSILWCGSRQIPLESDLSPRPILITAGSLGGSSPSRDLIVSPQHRIRLTGPLVRSEFRVEAVLAPARGLTKLPGIREMKGKRRVTYVSVLLTRHAVLCANGAEAESLYPGPQAMRALTPIQRQLVYRAVPGLAANGPKAYSPPAHPLLTVQETRALSLQMKVAAKAELVE